MIIQIYEIQTPQEAEKCIELGVDHMGSVLLSETHWKDESLKEVFRLSKGTATQNSLIPLFQNETILFKALEFYEPHLVHFCETLTDDRGRMLNLYPFIRMQMRVKTNFPKLKITRSIPIPEGNGTTQLPSLLIARELEPVSDFFLTDTWLGKEPVQGYIGITGKQVDGGLAKALVLQSRIPVILAGGLSAENVYDALKKTGAAGADSCTRTNRTDNNGKPIRFKKDFQKLTRFVSEVRRAQALDEKNESCNSHIKVII